MKPATTVLSCAGFLCLWRTRVSAHRDRVDRRLRRVARRVPGHLVEQVVGMAEMEQQEVAPRSRREALGPRERTPVRHLH